MTAPGENRLKLTLHYDGTRFFGWQIQREERTVQGELEAAILRLTRETRRVTGAGRTDRGVHALGQVASVVLPARWSPDRFRKAMNAVLPPDIWVADAAVAHPDFHPRFEAVARRYEYRLGLAEESASPFHRYHCWPLRREIDAAHLSRVAGYLLGEHSFAAFAKAGQPERGDRCHVTEARWTPWEDLGWRFTITANRFLHHMVRYLVGTMVEIARGRRSPDVVPAMLAGGGRAPETSAPAPPQGLFLVQVEYPARERDRSASSRAGENETTNDGGP